MTGGFYYLWPELNKQVAHRHNNGYVYEPQSFGSLEAHKLLS